MKRIQYSMAITLGLCMTLLNGGCQKSRRSTKGGQSASAVMSIRSSGEITGIRLEEEKVLGRVCKAETNQSFFSLVIGESGLRKELSLVPTDDFFDGCLGKSFSFEEDFPGLANYVGEAAMLIEGYGPDAVLVTSMMITEPDADDDDDGDGKGKGTDSDDKGTDSDDKGTDSDDKGTDSDDKGTDNEDKGTDNEDKGTDSEDKGTDSDGTDTDSDSTETDEDTETEVDPEPTIVNPPPSSEATQNKTVVLGSRRRKWKSTGIRFNSKTTNVQISVEGNVTYKIGSQVNADGVNLTDRQSCKIKRGKQFPNVAVLGKIGPQGTPFFIGQSLSEEVQQQIIRQKGLLFIIVNDAGTIRKRVHGQWRTIPCAADNNGAFEVHISHTQQAD